MDKPCPKTDIYRFYRLCFNFFKYLQALQVLGERNGFEVINFEETDWEDIIQGNVCDDEALFAGLFADLL